MGRHTRPSKGRAEAAGQTGALDLQATVTQSEQSRNIPGCVALTAQGTYKVAQHPHLLCDCQQFTCSAPSITGLVNGGVHPAHVCLCPSGCVSFPLSPSLPAVTISPAPLPLLDASLLSTLWTSANRPHPTAQIKSGHTVLRPPPALLWCLSDNICLNH